MFFNYLKIAVRHFAGHKMFSLVNISCLSVGITFCLIIGLYINNQISVNADLKNVESQYLLKSTWKDANTASATATVGPLARALKDRYPGLVKNYYRFVDRKAIISAGTNIVRENAAVGDTNLISMYGFGLAAGDPSGAFRDDRSAVISTALALRLFGNTDVINKTIGIRTIHNTSERFTITAVLKDQRDNTIIDPNAVKHNLFLPITADSLFSQSDAGTDWNNVFVSSFVELQPGIKAQQVTEALRHILLTNASDWIKTNLSVGLSGLKTYHLSENDGSMRKMIFALSLIAVFILLMAIINFVNLNIGLSVYRIKEIGLRKIFGTNKAQLIAQHLTESVILTVLAAVFAILLYEFVRPVFGDILSTAFPSFYQLGTKALIAFAVFILILGIISGIYPAFVLSATKLSNAVKGKIEEASRGVNLRKSLLIVQFTVAIIVFTSALIISKQVKYFFNKDLGYNKAEVLIISSLPMQVDAAATLKMQAVRDQLTEIPGVKSASLSTNIPDGKPAGSATLTPKGIAGAKLICPIIAADEHFSTVYGIQMKEGEFISNSNIRGQTVLNEAALRALGWDRATGANFAKVAGVPLTVTGVVKDFNISSLHDQVQPMVIMNIKDLSDYNYLSVKLHTNNIRGSVAAIQHKWNALYPEIPFEYFFMDDKFQSLYQTDLQLQRAAVIATVLNLVIVFLGVVGIVSLAIVKRTKEIAVRKVLGADTMNILSLFIKEYGLSMLIANMVALPLAYAITSRWLELYAYRIEQSAAPFIMVGIIMFVMMTLIIGLQCFKVAVSNPVNNLRTD